MAAFATTTVGYFENRADGPYAWNVRYDLAFDGQVVDVDLRIELTGADAGAERRAEWDQGISDIWNHKVLFTDGNRFYELSVDSRFVASGAHQVVNVVSGSGRGDMNTWYVTTEWGPDYVDEFAAHEFGHMLGAFDEYSGGATLDGYTTTGSLMSDFTVAGAKNFTHYLDGVLAQTEAHAAMDLDAVLATLGGAGADSLNGTAAMNGFYALGGNDRISARGGNDFIDGGTGRDSLIGGGGHDILKGGSGADRFIFNVRAASASDDLRDFNPVADLLAFDRAAFAGIGAEGDLAPWRYYEGSQATKPGQRFLYDTDSGKLWYDADGSGPGAKLLVATLGGAPHIGADDFLVI